MGSYCFVPAHSGICSRDIMDKPGGIFTEFLRFTVELPIN